MNYDYRGRPICLGCGYNITYIEMINLGGCMGCGFKLDKEELNKQPLKEFEENCKKIMKEEKLE